MLARGQNDFVLQVRDSFLNIAIFDNSGHVCFTFLKTKVGERAGGGGGRLVCGREGNCHRNNELC